MKPEQWRQIEALYHAALEHAPDARAAWLDAACAPALRRELDKLLAYDELAEHYLTEPLPDLVAEFFPPLARTGSQVAHYHVLERLGQGGMGEVYRAADTKLGRQVALKFLPVEYTRDDERVQRFKREARAASALNHPNILTIHDIGELDDCHYLVSEYVAGETLRARLQRGSLNGAEIVALAEQMAGALAAAHEAGIIHRDIKPENVMVRPDGLLKVLDFGLAKLLEVRSAKCGVRNSESETPHSAPRTPHSTAPGLVMGTVAYMSPEQARGLKVDHRTDIFSLGVLLYELAAGRRPFVGETTSDVMAAILHHEPPPLRSLRPDAPPALERLIRQMLVKDRAARLADARALRVELQSLHRALETEETLVTSAPALPNFVGREAELQRLADWLQAALAHEGRVVFVTGEAGIGKTTLTEQFLHTAQQRHPTLLCGRGRCVEQYGTGEAYLPFLDALGPLLNGAHRERLTQVLRTYAPTWCLQFPAVFAGAALEQLRRETIGATKERMLREMGDALGALATQTPVVLLLEDLHWADTSSAELLRHLSQRCAALPLLILGTLRPGDLAANRHPLNAYKLEMQAHQQCEEIALGALTRAQLSGYLDARFAPNDFAETLAPLIERQTEGHPLFATGLVQLLAERGDLVCADGQWTLTRPLDGLELEAPASVRGLIHKRFATLEAADRRLLQYASVEGEEFLSPVLAALLEADQLALEERCDQLARVHGLIELLGEEELPDGTLALRYRFAHALYQNVLYAELVSQRRIRLHRQAGEQWLQHYGANAARIAAPLARHFEHGRDFARAIAFLSQAGGNAARIYANVEAEAHYSHALRLVERLPASEQSAAALPLYQQRGAVNLALSRFAAAIEDFTCTLEQARAARDTARAATALNEIANTCFYAHRLAEMGAYAAEAMQVAQRAGDDDLRIEAMVLLAMKHSGSGELNEAKQLYAAALPAARASSPALPRGLVYRGILHFFQTEYAQAAALLTEAVARASAQRDGLLILQGMFFLGLSLGNQGRIAEALTTLHEALALAQRNGDLIVQARVPNSIGWLHRELGDVVEALRYDEQGLAIARQHRIVEAEANTLINLGQDYSQRHAAEPTRSAFQQVEAIFTRDEWNRWRFYDIRFQAAAAEHSLSQGDAATAAAHAERLLATATRLEVPKYIAVARKLLGELAIARGDLDAAATQFTQALAALHTHPAPLVAWQIHAALGRLHTQAGRAEAARAARAAAANIVQQIAAYVTDERLRATFLHSAAVRAVLEGQT